MLLVSKGGGKMMKNAVIELCRTKGWGAPQYDTINEGLDHLPSFRTTVTINGNAYTCPLTSSKKALAENFGAKHTLSTLANNGHILHISESPPIAKMLLSEVAIKKKLSPPAYTSTATGESHSPCYTTIVEFGGVQYFGEAAPTKKKAEGKAAFAALKGVDAAMFKEFDVLTVLAGIPMVESEACNSNAQLVLGSSQLVGDCQTFSDPSNFVNTSESVKDDSVSGPVNNGSELRIEPSADNQDKVFGNPGSDLQKGTQSQPSREHAELPRPNNLANTAENGKGHSSVNNQNKGLEDARGEIDPEDSELKRPRTRGADDLDASMKKKAKTNVKTES